MSRLISQIHSSAVELAYRRDSYIFVDQFLSGVREAVCQVQELLEPSTAEPKISGLRIFALIQICDGLKAGSFFDRVDALTLDMLGMRALELVVEPRAEQILMAKGLRSLVGQVDRLALAVEDFVSEVKVACGGVSCLIRRIVGTEKQAALDSYVANLEHLLFRYSSWRRGTRLLEQLDELASSVNYLLNELPLKALRVETSVYQFTKSKTVNPIYSGIPRVLKGRGWHVQFSPNFEMLRNLLAKDQASYRIVHFHQLDIYYHCITGDLEEAWRLARSVIEQIADLKRGGVQILWTLHNQLSHKPEYAEIDEYVEREMIGLADQVIVFGLAAEAYVRKYEQSRLAGASQISENLSRITKILHPSYEMVYPITCSREVARNYFGIGDDEFVICSPGEIKPYKNLTMVIKAVRALVERNRLKKWNPHKKIKLLLCGRVSPEGYVKELESLAGEETIIQNRLLSDEELGMLLRASDIAAFGYRSILASGAVVLALSTGLPVVAPHVGCLSEYVTDGVNGILYPVGNPKGLMLGMEQLFRGGEELKLDMNYCLFNRRHSLERVVDQLEEVFYRMAPQRELSCSVSESIPGVGNY